MKTVLIAGGSGLIGRRLTEMLRERGYNVRILTRSPRSGNEFAWNPAAGTVDEMALQSVDFVINLAGANLAEKRWTPTRKRILIESRVQSARTLRNAFQRTGLRPYAYLSSSAIGFYGNSGERMVTETDPPADQSFMVECCRLWESAADEIASLGIRTVKFRIGIVLAKEGGALAEFIRPLRFAIGGYFADGRAWYSWVHRDDVCRAFIWAIENQRIEGVYNVVAPNPVRNKALVKNLARAMRMPALFVPAPAFALRLALGELSTAILNSNHISSEKISRAGFHFQYPELAGALEEIFRRT